MTNTPAFLLCALCCLLAASLCAAIPTTNPDTLKQLSLSLPSVDAKQAPVWPFEWNATLIKINPVTKWIWWNKLYYDYPNNLARFDFYPTYYSTNETWNLTCSILFRDNKIYMFDPSKEACAITTRGIGVISPWWLKSATYKGTVLFKGMYCERWRLEELAIDYIARVDDIRTPVRSYNQVEDPGATDYVDVVLGPQNPSLFELPSYCSENKLKDDVSCPPF
ncbi:Proteophosphoglycan ppg4 [Balamuthia mandrillaris]